jgi:hypothetical protein
MDKSSPLPISIKEARKMLGKQSSVLNDDQIIELIGMLSLLAQNHLNKKVPR